MKKLGLLLAILCSLQANAQPYSISFAGTGLSTVKVQNLTTGVIVDVPAGDVLLLSTTTGIPEVNNMKSSRMKIYPNPMTDKSTLEILPPLAGDAVISVYDMTGKVLVQFKSYMENSSQEFTLSGIKNGLHVINVQGNGYQSSEKLLSNGKSNGIAIITRIGNNIQSVVEKKSKMDSKGVQGNVNMAYNTGERLKYTAVSGNNKTVMTDIPVANKTVTFTFTECKDGDNIYYPVVTINTQVWMAENLKTTKYNDGYDIQNIILHSDWFTQYEGAYCDFDDTPSNSNTYGRLYNWYTVDNNAATKFYSNGGRNVCPTGWHIPTDAEWTTLITYLGGEEVAGGKLKETGTDHWVINTAATNETGFTALPGGYREGGGTYRDIGWESYCWSATESGEISGYGRFMYYDHSGAYRPNLGKIYGFSVRCVKD
jgi:uncharacterized protein (TIGR02145 family)